MRWILAVLIALASLSRAADPPNPVAAAAPPTLEVFVREGCPHCADAKRWIDAELRRERPDLRITLRDVMQDKEARARLEALALASGGISVPAFHANGELLVGFIDAKTSGPRIRQLLDHGNVVPILGGEGECKVAADEAASCAAPKAEPAAPAEPEGSVTIPWIGKTITIEDVGLPAFTVAIGLLDGFNPCSMWVLILMISMLAAVGDRRRMLLIAGTFVAVEGLAYFAFMAAWLNLFLVIGISRPSEIALGVIALVAGLIHVKDFFAFGRGISLSIPERAKPGIYQRMRALVHQESLVLAVVGTIVLAVLVQFVELVCTSGLPALYTRILTNRQLDAWSYYGYILLYNVVYMFDDVIVLAIGVVTLSQKRLQEKEGRMLKLVSGLAMVGLGAYLLA